MLLTERIKCLAEPLGLTFAKIERETGLGRGTIRKWDTNCPSADKLFRVANLLNTSIDYLMGNEPPIFIRFEAEDAEWIKMIHRLPKERQYELKGYLKRMLEEAESVENHKNGDTISFSIEELREMESEDRKPTEKILEFERMHGIQRIEETVK